MEMALTRWKLFLAIVCAAVGFGGAAAAAVGDGPEGLALPPALRNEKRVALRKIKFIRRLFVLMEHSAPSTPQEKMHNQLVFAFKEYQGQLRSGPDGAEVAPLKRALQLAQALGKSSPDTVLSREGRRLSGALSYLLGDRTAGEGILRTIGKSSPDESQRALAWYSLGLVRAALGDGDGAIKALDHVPEKQIGMDFGQRVLLLKAMVYETVDWDPVRCIEASDRLFELIRDGTLRSTGQNNADTYSHYQVMALLRKTAALIGLHRYAEATACLESVRDKASSSSLRGLATSLLRDDMPARPELLLWPSAHSSLDVMVGRLQVRLAAVLPGEVAEDGSLAGYAKHLSTPTNDSQVVRHHRTVPTRGVSPLAFLAIILGLLLAGYAALAHAQTGKGRARLSVVMACASVICLAIGIALASFPPGRVAQPPAPMARRHTGGTVPERISPPDSNEGPPCKRSTNARVTVIQDSAAAISLSDQSSESKLLELAELAEQIAETELAPEVRQSLRDDIQWCVEFTDDPCARWESTVATATRALLAHDGRTALDALRPALSVARHCGYSDLILLEAIALFWAGAHADALVLLDGDSLGKSANEATQMRAHFVAGCTMLGQRRIGSAWRRFAWVEMKAEGVGLPGLYVRAGTLRSRCDSGNLGYWLECYPRGRE
jgi:hypothetical protein